MHWSDFRWRRVHFDIRKCGSLRRPMWMNDWHKNARIYENERFINSLLHWRFSCPGLRRLQHQNESNFRCTSVEPDKGQPYGQMLIGRGQLSNWSAKSIRWELLNASFSMNYSNIMSNNYCTMSGLRQLVPEAYSPKLMLKWQLLRKKQLTGR